ncbi:hypothetical protein AVEN_30351-1 [Araneus ventricosus]|uniref:Uncharacterized protein n=1 Tax=Araneus ventricosus TaxID=182803 RepID=A0A4Y2SBG3_ARAVE|nr:hypothetical protein AVEN_30351-1 [Araneus ventricosus]
MEHFKRCDSNLITSDAPIDEDIVYVITEKNDLIDDSSSDIEDGGDASSGPSISDAKLLPTACCWNNIQSAFVNSVKEKVHITKI